MADVRISFEFTPEQVDTLLEGLHSLPHGRVRSLFDAIRDHAIKTVDEARAAATPKAQRRKKAPPGETPQAPAA